LNVSHLEKNDCVRIAVLGYIVRGPFGGMAWHHLQYVLGLVQLGHDVLFVEDSDDYAGCYDPGRRVMDIDPSYGLRFAASAFDIVGLGDHWAYHDAHTGRWHGPRAGDAQRFCGAADLVLNISGANPLRPWMMDAPARVLVDTDPGFTQIRHLTEPHAAARAALHTAFFSFGENLPLGRSAVPDDGLPWQATRQPLVAEAWPVTPVPASGFLTTVMQWDSYPPREYGGVAYGMKSDSFEPYAGLPARVGPRFELAIGNPTAPLEQLRAGGWRVRDSQEVAGDALSYQRYIAQSHGEFAVAKHGYVVGCTGWFSERSVGYLASGRPVVVQDTGFTSWLEPGAGVLAFRTPDEAAAAVEEVLRRGPYHGKAAREVALSYFDARDVLTRLIERAFNRESPVRAAGTEQGSPYPLPSPILEGSTHAS
jgi:hypothetical protein